MGFFFFFFTFTEEEQKINYLAGSSQLKLMISYLRSGDFPSVNSSKVSVC